MKLKWNLILVFSSIMIVTVGIFSYITQEMLIDGFIENDLHEMREKILEKELRMENLHDRASEDLVFALKNPLFVEYFELPETKAGNVFEDGVLQFMSNDKNSPSIDSETCELYIENPQFNGRKYIDEYDSKCLDFKNLNP